MFYASLPNCSFPFLNTVLHNETQILQLGSKEVHPFCDSCGGEPQVSEDRWAGLEVDFSPRLVAKVGLDVFEFGLPIFELESGFLTFTDIWKADPLIYWV